MLVIKIIHHQLQSALILIVVIVIALVSVGCSSANQSSNQNATSELTPSTKLAATVTSDIKQADDEDYNKYLAQQRTEVALTHYPTDPPGPASPVAPEPTIAFGISLCGGATASSYDYQFVDCWVGNFNNKIYIVATMTDGYGGNPNNSYIAVFDKPLLYPITQVYTSPLRVGDMLIEDVNGSVFTLAGIDPAAKAAGKEVVNGTPVLAYIYFDLATRQFQNQSGTPIITTPVPTVAPLVSKLW